MAAGGEATSAALLVIQLGEHHKTRLRIDIPMRALLQGLLMLLLVSGLGFWTGHEMDLWEEQGIYKEKKSAPRHLLLNVGPADGLAAPAGKDLLLLRSRPDKVHPPCAAQESNRWCGNGYYNTIPPTNNSINNLFYRILP
jgi:hypothetical protein